MKIILSRKGFDSKSGGYPSPILPDGTLLSLPIPEDNTGIYYKDLKANNDMTYLDIMRQLGMNKYNENSTAHLDPDINCSIKKRENGWEALYGQGGATLTHMKNHKVGVGDIFLFWGWFRNTIKTPNGLKYDPNDKNGKHIIYGYMEICDYKKIDDTLKENCPSSYLEHPHFKLNYLNNTVYIGKDKFSYGNINTPGAGVFNKLGKDLILSFDTEKRSLWKLPLFFHPDYNTTMTYHEDIKRWEIQDQSCILQTVGRGQAFVVYGNDCIENWAKNLIINNSR